MCEDFVTASSEKEFSISETMKELASLYEEVSKTQSLEDDWTKNT